MTFRPSSAFPTPEVLKQNLQQLKNGTISWIQCITEIWIRFSTTGLRTQTT